MIREERNALFLLLAFAAAAGLLYLLILQPGLERAQRPAGKRPVQAAPAAVPADNRPKAARRMVSLRAELRDAVTGVPLRAAQATVLDISDIAEPAVAVDESGLLCIEYLPPEITFGLQVACAGHVTRTFPRLRADAKEIIDLGLVTLAPLRRLHGLIGAPGGGPARDCAVSVFWLDADGASADPLRRAAHLAAALLAPPAASASAGEDGSFALEGLAAGAYAVYVVGKPHASALLTHVDVELDDCQLRIELQGGYPVQGRIAVAGAGPLAEGTVLLLEAGPPLARRLSAAYCRTDAAGFFAHHALSPRPHFVFVAGAPAASSGCGPFVFPYGEELALTAAQGLTAAGLVLDGNRLPVKNALVTAQGEAPGQVAVAAATDEKGRFLVSGLAQGVAELQVDAAGYALDRTRLEVRPPGAEVRVQLLPAGVLAGVVRDALGPLAGACVLAARPERCTIADAEGRYRLEGLPAGPVEIVAQAPGHASAPRRVEVRLHHENIQDFLLQPGGEIRILVNGPADLPVAGAEVLAVPVDDAGAPAPAAPRAAFTDSRGYARLARLPAGQRVALLAAAGGRAPARSEPFLVAPEHGAAGVALTLAQPGRIAGRVTTPAGVPLEGARVRVTLPDEAPALDQLLLALAAPDALTAEDGGFTLNDLPPGEYAALAERPGASSAWSARIVLGPGAATSGVTCVQEGAEPVTGQVTTGSGAAAGAALVRLLPLHQDGSAAGAATECLADAAGWFSFPRPPTPAFLLTAERAGAGSVSLRVTGEAGPHHLLLSAP